MGKIKKWHLSPCKYFGKRFSEMFIEEASTKHIIFVLLQVTRTCIIFLMNSNSSQIRLHTVELLALEHRKNVVDTIASSFFKIFKTFADKA